MQLRPAAIVFLLASLPAGARAQTTWPMFQADETHRGYVPVAVDVDSFKLRWQKSVSTKALNPVTTSGDKVFVTEQVYFVNGSLIALDTSDGSVAWTTSLGAPFSINPPSYDDGKVYVQTGDHASDTWLHCFSADDGSELFAAPHAAQWEHYLAPTIKDGVVYVNGGYYGGMYAFDGTSGAQLWFNGLMQYDTWTPAVDAEHAYAYVGGVFYALKRTDGTTDYSITDPHYSWSGYSMNLAPVLGDLKEALVIYNGRLMSFDLGQQTFGWDVAGAFTGQPALHAGIIYAVGGGELLALDEATGAVLWSWSDTGKTLIGTPIITDSHVFVRNATRVHAVDLVSQTSVWSYKDSGAMSLGASALFLARSDGTVTALEFAPVPSVHSIDPARTLYVDPPISATIHGTGFDDGTTPHVRFGGVDATDVVLVDDSTITCTLPANGPGATDVEVENGVGHDTLSSGFVFTPAVALSGSVERGASVDLTCYSRPGDQIFAVAGVPPKSSLPTPPFAGALEVLPFHVLFLLLNWPFEDFTLRLDVPDDPALAGLTFDLQALIGHGLVGTPKDGAWSNCLEVTIE